LPFVIVGVAGHGAEPRFTLPLVNATEPVGAAAPVVTGIEKVIVSAVSTMVGLVATATVSVVVLDEIATGVVRAPPA
jgi:hypothetical protein